MCITQSLAQFGGVQRRYDWSTVSPSVAIIETIAVFENDESREAADVLETPLNEYVSTDVLDAVVGNDSFTAISLTISDYDVRISGNTVGVALAKADSDRTR